MSESQSRYVRIYAKARVGDLRRFWAMVLMPITRAMCISIYLNEATITEFANGMCLTWLKALHSRRRKRRKLPIESWNEMFLCRAHVQY